MVEQEHNERLNKILNAVRDATRRELLTLLVQHGPTRVTDLARHFDMSLNSVSKHIKILEGADLVSRKTAWREHLIEANLEPVQEIDHWFSQLRSIWDMRLQALDEALDGVLDSTQGPQNPQGTQGDDMITKDEDDE